MNKLFRCKTSEAYVLKNMVDLLSSNLKSAFLEISNTAINLRMTDTPQNILIDMELHADKFESYKLYSPNSIYIGLTLSHLSKILKSVKKTDIVHMFINKDSDELGIRTIPSENSRIITSYIKIRNIQRIHSELIEGYERNVIVNSKDFQKMYKELMTINGSAFTISSTGSTIEFSTNADDIMKRSIVLGELPGDNMYDDDNMVIEYEATFLTNQLSKIHKLSTLSKIIYIYICTNELPILFKTSVGNIGDIAIYLKPRQLTDIIR